MTALLTTRKGQTVQDLTTEFFTALQKSPSGGKDAEALFDFYVQLEQHPELAQPTQDKTSLNTTMSNTALEIEKLISEIGPSKLSVYDLTFMKRIQPHISKYLLAWIAPGCSGIPDCLNTLIGFCCVEFYKTHDAMETVTLSWLKEHGGYGKILTHRDVVWWFLASKVDDEHGCFDTITEEQLYLSANPVQQMMNQMLQ